jgi:hypothetical protein
VQTDCAIRRHGVVLLSTSHRRRARVYRTATTQTHLADWGSAYGWDRGGAAYSAEQPAAADACQRPLVPCSRFQARLSCRVSWLYEVRMMTGRDAAKEVSSAVLAERQDSRGGGSRCRKGRHTGGTSQTMLAGLTPDAV